MQKFWLHAANIYGGSSQNHYLPNRKVTAGHPNDEAEKNNFHAA